MNSRLLKWMVLPGARPTPVGLLSLAVNESFGDGTIGMSRGEARYKFPYLVSQLSVFFALARYTMVKIMCSSSEVVLGTMKNYKAHYNLSWFKPPL
jgi:hypothetical protein